METIIAETLRYLRVSQPDADIQKAVEAAAKLVTERAAPRYLYREFGVSFNGECVELPEAGLTLPGKLAAGMLRECGRAALLICTLGAEFDRLLRSAQARDMAQAVILDACGSALVERGCDEAEREIAARHPGQYLTDRFSPGYGDLPLSLQPELLRVLDGTKRLGVCVTDSLLLNPMKTVTAIIGLSNRPQPAKIRGCAFCMLNNHCAYRKRGMTCGASA